MTILPAQDVVFSQFYNAPLELNPSLAGISHRQRIVLNYRNQYSNLNRAYTTYAMGYDFYSPYLHGGLGIHVIKDDSNHGILQNLQITGTYSYHTMLTHKMSLLAGLQGGLVQASINTSQIVVYQQLDPISGGTVAPLSTFENLSSASPKTTFSFGSGIVLFTPKMVSGLSLQYLNNPDVGWMKSSKIPLRFVLHGGYELRQNKFGSTGNLFLTPNVLIAHQSNFTQATLGVLAGSDLFFGGISLRHVIKNMDAMVFVIGVQKGIFKMGYSFDFNISTSNGLKRSTHELSLALTFGKTYSESSKYRRKIVSNPGGKLYRYCPIFN